MFILFKKLIIKGFQSIGYEEIDLNNKGTVIIKGINKFEDKTDSNGSGKSSVAEALMYTLYGKTSSGISNPKNRYINGGCSTIVEFSIDNINYKVIRSISDETYGTGLKIYKNEEDISGRNKTDSENILSNIIGINSDIFLSIVFLSQGYNNRITSLTPSQRKNRIETITSTSEKVEQFKTNLSVKKEEYLSKERIVSNKISNLEGQLKIIDDNIIKLEKLIDSYNKSIEENDMNIDINVLKEKLSTLRNNKDKLNEGYMSLNQKISKLSQEISQKNIRINSINSNIEKIKLELTSVNSSVCPVCKQSIDKNITESLKIQRENEISNYTEEKIELEKSKKELVSSKELYDKKLKDYSDKISKINKQISLYEDTIRKKENMTSIDINSTNSDIKDNKSKKVDINSELSKLNKERLEINDNIGIISSSIQIVTKQFRDYMMNNITEFINLRLDNYSEMLFSKDTKIYINNNKLEVFLDDGEYGSLSGGEKRKVDLALSLAQRDLALNISGLTSNILILDEVMDNLDEKATRYTLNMITNISSEIDSLYIISHNQYDIPYDNIMVIEKDENRVSSIRYES